MGALEYVPATSEFGDIDQDINVTKMVQFASDVLNQREAVALNAEEKLTYSQLVQVGSSAGGARAKALIAWNEATNEIRSGQLNLGKDFDYWLMKFDNVSKNGDHGLEDAKEYTMEFAVPGVNKDFCRISINGEGNLEVAIENKLEHKGDDKHEHYLRREFCYSNFQQAYILPDDVVKEEISASVNNGILSVKLPKMTKEHIDKIQRNIDIK